VHFRRAILLFALVLGLTALATSISPSPRQSSTQPAQPAPPPATGASSAGATIAFTAPPTGVPPRRAVAVGRPLVVQVASAALGQATIPQLGQVGAVDPGTPASFAVLPSPGSYDVVFTPSAGGPATKVGTLVVKG
jgi:hypothetical protein